MISFFDRIRTIALAGIREQTGVSLPEVLIAAMLLGIAITSGVSALASTKHATVAADRSAAAARVAQSALEGMRKYDYETLAIQGDVTNSDIAAMSATDRNRFQNLETSAATFRPNNGSSLNEGLVELSDGETTGAVVAAPSIVSTVSNSSPLQLRVWKFVSWRDEACNATETSPSNTCAGARDTKRITVAVQPITTPSSKTVWMSSIVVDPSAGGHTPGNSAPVDSYRTQDFYLHDIECAPNSTGDVNPTLAGNYPVIDHVAHDTARDGTTTSSYSFCSNTAAAGTMRRPDLMNSQHPLTRNSAHPAYYPQPRYSAVSPSTALTQWDQVWNSSPRVYGYGPSGLAMKRSVGCPQTYPANNNPDSASNIVTPNGNLSRWNVHTWATNKMPAGGFDLRGRITLDLFTGMFGRGATGFTGNPGSNGVICISILDMNDPAGPSATNPKLIYSFYCALNGWPQGRAGMTGPLPDGMAGVELTNARTCWFNPQAGQPNTADGGPAPANAVTWPAVDSPTPYYNVAANHRLMFRLSVCGAGCGAAVPPVSQHDLVFFYDHEQYPAKISFATNTAPLTN